MRFSFQVACTLMAFLSIIIILASTANSTSIIRDSTSFEDVYVIVKDRGRISNGSDDWVVLEFTVIGNYRSEDGDMNLSDGDVLYFIYDKTVDKKYNELDEGDVFKIDCFLSFSGSDKAIIPTLPYYHPVESGKIIVITSIEESDVPPSLWKYYLPQTVILLLIVVVIGVLIFLITLVIFLRRKLKNKRDTRAQYLKRL